MSDKPDGTGLTVDLVTRSEWAAVESADKNFTTSVWGAVFGDMSTVNYVVPAGKKLYITQYAFQQTANAAADADNQQHVSILLEDVTAGTQFQVQGGNGGGGLSLNKPFVIPAGHQYAMTVTCRANHTTSMRADSGGYEQ
jgi:hypothetical protein